jgi:hypothetical protein
MDVAALGAFLSGAGAVLSSVYALRAMRRRAERNCDKRIEEVKRALHEGYEMRKGDDE